jgi:isopropanol dehydrogenase (NADP+)
VKAAVEITKPGGTISSTGYFGGRRIRAHPPRRVGAGMVGKTIATGLCPAGRLRMERLLRVLKGSGPITF